MKRYPVFALIALLFLLLVLLGSWVYLEHYPWPSGEPGQEHTAGTDAGRSGRDAGDLLDEAETGNADETDSEAGTGKGGPLEAPPEPVRRANPPEPIDTGGKVKDADTTGDKTGDTVVAELTPGLAAIRDGSGGEEGIEPFIVSTLRPAIQRLGPASITLPVVSVKDAGHEVSTGTLLHEKPDDDASRLGDAFAKMLVGQLIWPALSETDEELLRSSGRRQAVVYLDNLPEFRTLVDADEGWFSLPMTKRMDDDYRAKGLRLVVHSPAFEISGGFEALRVKKDDGPIKVSLQVAPIINVVVDVTPPEAVEAGVRVWLERRGMPETPDYDDSLYMSAKVPSTGRLVFSVPEHYGELRVAATGEVWHSGLPQIVKLRDWKTNKINVSLSLAGDRCDYVTGSVLNDYRQAPVKGARLESTHFGTTVYSGPDGKFEMWVPMDSYAGNRQFQCTAADLRPEVLPLETRASGTSGVEGSGPTGPFKVAMAGEVRVLLYLPKEAARLAPFTIPELHTGTRQNGINMESKGSDRLDTTLPWGIHTLTLRSLEKPDEAVTIWIDDSAWQDVLRFYASGKESVTPVGTKTVGDVFKKR
ncbi:MAG: hypothetical protein KDB90_00975 [Planctomycetes bacterium]|nr:hypothetical protein [Planctomycetota bacterium]